MLQADVAFRDALSTALWPVFEAEATFIADDPRIVAWLAGAGCKAHVLDPSTIARLPKPDRQNVVLVPSSDVSFAFGTLDHFFKGSRLLIVPVAAFDPGFDAARYTLELVAESDFVTGAAQNAAWLERLNGAEAPLRFAGENGELTCELRERLIMMKPQLKAKLNRGEWEAIGSFFEIALVPDNEDFFHPGYIVDGRLRVDGVAVARHRIMPEGLEPLHAEAWEFFANLRRDGHTPLELTIENSRVTGATAGGRDIVEELLRFSNPKRELVLVEMAISNNPGLEPSRLDWSHNSVLNEGSRGIHVAVGDGVTGAHIDFICPGIELLDDPLAS